MSASHRFVIALIALIVLPSGLFAQDESPAPPADVPAVDAPKPDPPAPKADDPAPAADPPAADPPATDDIPPLEVPNDQANAATVLAAWVKKRGVDVQRQGNTVQYRHDNVLVNVLPMVYEDDLDRLIVTAYFTARDEFKGTQALAGLAADKNAAQNFLRVFIDADGDFGVSASMTFYDEVEAREYDAFMNAFVVVMRAHVLTENSLKLLN